MRDVEPRDVEPRDRATEVVERMAEIAVSVRKREGGTVGQSPNLSVAQASRLCGSRQIRTLPTYAASSRDATRPWGASSGAIDLIN